jgi:hypothetical protein
LFVPQSYPAAERPQENQNATSWEILTLRLGRFARQLTEELGAGSITDEMLQNEARLILYGEADGWEQTAADNAEWLNLFKKAHGMEPKSPVVGESPPMPLSRDLLELFPVFNDFFPVAAEYPKTRHHLRKRCHNTY